ncbi:PorT family protein [Chryseolinea soli]|uniref:PorT family protein n=1 Tax=Chryseolinea soli TaxID=2321403 RepID=A0A385SPA7_9BACT|nr:PorT family protein [Chryseolinea soli]
MFFNLWALHYFCTDFFNYLKSKSKVKAFFSSALLVLFCTVPVFSQILVGPEIGGNYSWTSFGDKDLKDVYNVSPVFGFHAGGHLAFLVRKRFFLHASLLYSTKGRVLKGDPKGADFDAEFKNTSRYNYIDMPISYTVDFKGKIGKGKEFKYFLGIGPNVSYWLGGKGTVYNSELKENNFSEQKYKIVFNKDPATQGLDEMNVQNPNRLQLGLNLVAGAVFEPGLRQRLMVTIRYELGHTYLAKSNGTFTQTYFQDPLQSRNQGFRISVAYLYDLKTENRKRGKSTIDRKNPGKMRKR